MFATVWWRTVGHAISRAEKETKKIKKKTICGWLRKKEMRHMAQWSRVSPSLMPDF
jgi:hypothetical protein